MITSQTRNRYKATEPTIDLIGYWLSNVNCYFKWLSNDTPLLTLIIGFIPISIKRLLCHLDYKSMGLFTWTRDSELPRGKSYLAFTWWFVVPGQRYPGSTSLPRGKFIVIWSLRIYLNSFSFYTNCYREWISDTFTYFWGFLELFIGKFIPNINNEQAQGYSCPRAIFAFCSHGEKLPRQDGLPGVVQWVTRLSKLPQGNEKLMWTVNRRQTVQRGKVDAGVSELPRGNELSRNHVNRPFVSGKTFVRAISAVQVHVPNFGGCQAVSLVFKPPSLPPPRYFL